MKAVYVMFLCDKYNKEYSTLCVHCETVVFFVVKNFYHKGYKGFTKDTTRSVLLNVSW